MLACRWIVYLELAWTAEHCEYGYTSLVAMETRGIMGCFRLSANTLVALFIFFLLIGHLGTSAQCPNNSDLVCQNGAQCVETASGPRCQCTDGVSGDFCEIVGTDDCSTPTQHACQHNAKCVDGDGNYTCNCLSGWEGRFCEKEKDECQPQPCENGGNCTDEFDGFSCACPPAYNGSLCDTDVNECASPENTPCQNGICHNQIGGFKCECVSGYTGDLCETEINECASSPCHFGGKCVDLINNFRCECLDGFAGPQCEGVVQECQLSDVCGDNGICIEKPLGGYQCFCKPGHYGKHCETQVNLCDAGPCKNGATCVNHGTDYTCLCKTGFTGKDCDVDIKECEAQPCLNNASCSEPTPGSYSCQCRPGFTGQKCGSQIDECQTSPCPSYKICVDLINDFRCDCPPGKAGNLCDVAVFDCRVTTCLNEGVCIEGSPSHTCSCPTPFTGDSCDTSLDQCVPNPCIHDGKCRRRANGDGYWCDCLDGFVGDRCEADIYDCMSGPCLNNATCEDVPFKTDAQNGDGETRKKFFCRCLQGFTGRLCETEIDACWGNQCLNNANCTVTGKEEYTCQCQDSWTGKYCQDNVNECLTVPSICHNDGQCIDLTPGFRCVCQPPWSGPVCTQRTLYCSGNDTCQNGGTCLEGSGNRTYTCQCTDAFTGTNCSTQKSPCLPINPCGNNGTCEGINQTSGGDAGGQPPPFTCQCPAGYTGQLCQGNIDECTILKPCQNNGTCRDGINNFTCDCTPEWKGHLCEVRVDWCSPSPCGNGGVCLPDDAGEEGSGYRCQCALGFTGVRCEKVLDDCQPKTCQNNGTCVQEVSGFTCQCLPGFSGLYCEGNIDDCKPNPCNGSATCKDLTNDFVCTCPPGYTGRTCDVKIEECERLPCKHGGICNAGVGGHFSCTCPSGVNGDTCQNVVTASFVGNSNLNLPSIKEIMQSGAVADSTQPPTAGRKKRHAFNNEVHDMESLASNILSTSSMYGDTQHRDVLVRRKREAEGSTSGVEGENILISFTFTTTVMEGILLLATGTSPNSQPQHTAVELQAPNYILFSLSNGRQTMKRTLSLNSAASSVHSHAVAITLGALASKMEVTTSSCGNQGQTGCPQTALTFQNSTAWNLDGAFHFGGVAEFSPYTRSVVAQTRGFTGCLGNLAVNGKSVNLATAKEFELPVSGDSPTSTSTFISSPPQPGCATHPPCLADQCSNRGKCLDLWTSKTCQCRVGFTGPKCEVQNTAQFESDNMIYAGSFDEVNEISFWLTGRQNSGLLVYTVSGDALSISVDGGRIRMAIVFVATGRDLVSKVSTDLQLENWVKVTLTLKDNSYSLILTSEGSTTTTVPTQGSAEGTSVSPIRVNGPMFVGALHPHPALGVWRKEKPGLPSTNSMEGCIRDLKVNGKVINFLDSVQSSLGNDPPKPSAGCGREESCQSLQCSNQGVCLPAWGEASCQCDENFTGDRCDNATAFTFDGVSSYSVVEIDRKSVAFGDFGGIEFRTRREISTLLLMQIFTNSGGSQTIEFRIFSGHLQVYSSFTQATVQSKEPVSDGQWHSLSWKRENDDVWHLSLDGDTFDLKAGFNPYHPDLKHMVHVYVGARPLSTDTTNGQMVGFLHGCVRNVTFNSHLINLGVGKQDGVTSRLTSVRSGCHNSSACTVNPCPANTYCLDQWHSFSCRCLPGWEGPHCNRSTDDCQLNVCQNNATCVDHHLSYSCDCPPQFTGRLCQTAFEPCLEQVCSVDHTVSCNSFNYSYFVCECKPGYDGRLCQSLIDNCLPGPCLNDGVCVNEVNNFTCKCARGYIGHRCQVRDYCISSPCYNGGTCSLLTSISNSTSSSLLLTNSSLPFTCSCKQPYFGAQCQQYNYCQENKCQNNATCLLQPSRHTCNCTDGFYGTYCEFKDTCFTEPCLNGGECRNSVDSHICLCPSYFTGQNCEAPLDQCLKNVCLNGATCVFNSSVSSSSSSSSSSTSQSYECICLQGFTGNNCEVDINECEAGPCKNNASCVESSSLTRSKFFPGYRCQCAPGFAGVNCEEDVDECGRENPCRNGGRCVDNVNGYNCICPDGFVNPDCSVDRRGCGSGPCRNNAQCLDGEGGNYTCVCSPGFEGTLCENNIDDCQSHDCTNGGMCVDGINNYTCKCLSGYSGVKCEDISDACYTQPCHHGGVCRYRGVCSCGDVVIACGWHDEACQTQRCQARTDCRALSPSYTCNCSGTGYQGVQCTQDADECAVTGSNPCQHEGVCVNAVGGFSCDCKDTGYKGDACQDDVNECLTKPCFNGGTCVNVAGSFQCQCTDSWTGLLCGEKRDNCQKQPCLNKGVCANQADKFSCNCDGTGFEGEMCEKNVDDCVNNRCQHGGLCQDGVRQYTCVCNGTGYTGQFCQDPSSNCGSLSCLNNGTCAEVTAGGTPVCLCIGTGYHGNRCQYDSDECQDGNHACRGVYLCKNTAGSYTCLCGKGYEGTYCEKALFGQDDSSEDVNGSVIAVCVLLVLFLLAVLVLYAFWHLKRKRKTQGHYKPSLAEGVAVGGGIPMDKLAHRDERLI